MILKQWYLFSIKKTKLPAKHDWDFPIEMIERLFTPKKWIHDGIINRFMYYLNEKQEIHNKKVKVFYQNTFMYHSLITKDYNIEEWKSKLPFSTFYDYDLIIIPVYKRPAHWTLGVIDIEEKTILHYNTMDDIEFDRQAVIYLKKYIELEHRDIAKGYNEIEWTVMLTSDQRENAVPKQITALGDCGIFIILFAEMIGNKKRIRGITQDYILSHQLRKKMAMLLLSFNYRKVVKQVVLDRPGIDLKRTIGDTDYSSCSKDIIISTYTPSNYAEKPSKIKLKKFMEYKQKKIWTMFF